MSLIIVNVEDKKGKKFENSYINISSALEATEKDLQLEKTVYMARINDF